MRSKSRISTNFVTQTKLRPLDGGLCIELTVRDLSTGTCKVLMWNINTDVVTSVETEVDDNDK